MSEKSLKTTGEFGLIKILAAQCASTLRRGQEGIGDDCAVLPLTDFSKGAAGSLLVTSDVMVENIHFKREFTSAAALGHKLLAVSLSDIAAMGGVPRAALVNLQLTSDTGVTWVKELYEGIIALANMHGVSIVGGDTVSGRELALTATVFGIAEYAPILRSGAKAGDGLWVSGTIGGACAGLAVLGEELSAASEADRVELKTHYGRPEPQLALGKFLSVNKLASAMIDISDGLFQDAGHIAEQSAVVIEIELDKIPVSAAAHRAGLDNVAAASGGDDYQLLFTAGPGKEQELLAISAEFEGVELPVLQKIGVVRAMDGAFGGDKVVARTSSGEVKSIGSLLAGGGRRGYEHFLS